MVQEAHGSNHDMDNRQFQQNLKDFPFLVFSVNVFKVKKWIPVISELVVLGSI